MFQRIIGLLLLLMAACSAQSTGSVATSCEACHSLARCHDNSVETVGVSCRCDDGLVGDGFTCYNTTTCNTDCCDHGFRWSPLQGCVDIDECSMPGPPCGPGQLCQNTRGSFSCLVTPNQHHSETTSRSVTFACGGAECPFGESCLQVNGTSQCIDPCQHHSVLQDAWRATDARADPQSVACDSRTDWQGWYRLYLGNSSVRMPERCIESNMCGTDAPLRLRSPHPLESEGIVRAEVCGSWEGGCCQFHSNFIHVKACPRNYYVYKFVSPNLCRLAYCADVNTMVCSTCAEGETCLSYDKINWRCGQPGVAPTAGLRLVNGDTPCSGRVEILHDNQWGTVCDDGWDINDAKVVCRQLRCGPVQAAASSAHFGQGTGPIWLDDVACTGGESSLSECGHPGFGTHNCNHGEDAGVICSGDLSGFPEPELVCGQDLLRLTVQKRLLEERGLNASSAHLIDPRCHQQVDQQEAMCYLVQRQKGLCGNVVETNGSHITYSNILFVYPSDWSDASLSVPMSIPFSCVFPLDDITSLDAAIRYQLPRRVGVVRSGAPTRAQMTLYKRPDYSEPFPGGPVRLPLGAALHVGVSVENDDNNRFVLVLENCYVTKSPRADDPARYVLIQNRCPVDHRHVTLGESGVSQRARFSALLFLYHGTYEDVYLHCRISLCDGDSAPCSPNCSRRRARSATAANQLPVSVGPISWS